MKISNTTCVIALAADYEDDYGIRIAAKSYIPREIPADCIYFDTILKIVKTSYHSLRPEDSIYSSETIEYFAIKDICGWLTDIQNIARRSGCDKFVVAFSGNNRKRYQDSVFFWDKLRYHDVENRGLDKYLTNVEEVPHEKDVDYEISLHLEIQSIIDCITVD